MGVFDAIASGYDRGMLPLELLALRRLRSRAFASVEGRVLELGVGTGVNLALYRPRTHVVAVDASRPMLDCAARYRERVALSMVQADVQALPFAGSAFETVTGSLLFCSVPDPARALGEVRRVLQSGGRLVLVEHTRGRGLGAWLTDVLAPLWAAISRSCRLDRDTVQTVVDAGFTLAREERRVLGIFRLIEAVKQRHGREERAGDPPGDGHRGPPGRH